MPNFKLFFCGSATPPSEIFQQGIMPERESKEALSTGKVMYQRKDCITISETFVGASTFPELSPNSKLNVGMNSQTTYVYLVVVDTERDELEYHNQSHRTLSESTMEHLIELYAINKIKPHLVRTIPKEHVLTAYTIERNIYLNSFLPPIYSPDLQSIKILSRSDNLDPEVLNTEEFSKTPGLMDKYKEEQAKIAAMTGITQPCPVAHANIFALIDMLRSVYFVLKKNNMAVPKEISLDDFLPESPVSVSQTQSTFFAAKEQTVHHAPTLFEKVMAGEFDDEIRKDEVRLKGLLDDFFLVEITKRGDSHMRMIKDALGDKFREYGMVKTLEAMEIALYETDGLTIHADPEEMAGGISFGR